MESNMSENEMPSNNLSDYLDRLEKSAGSNRDTDGLGTMAAGTFVVGSLEAINREDGKEAHGPVRDVHYLVEADTEDDAIERQPLAVRPGRRQRRGDRGICSNKFGDDGVNRSC
jgi:hypothetical protein